MTVEKVAIVTEPLAISIYNDTPVVTIEDLNTGSITITDGSPAVRILSDQLTKVIVSSGIGNSYDVSTILNMLASRVGDAALSAQLMTDISHIRDLWIRVGNQIILTHEDGINIQNASTIYTDQQIANIVAALIVMDGRVDLTMSAISQEAARIDLSVAHLTALSENVSLAEARIALTEDSIASTVTRLDSLDGPTGVVSQLQSSIDQTATSLGLAVAETQQNKQDIIQNAAGLSITSNDLSLYVAELDTVKSNLNSAQVELTETSITSLVNQSMLGVQGYRLTAAETMLANKWGISIAETGGGVNYVTGMGLVLHPNWNNGFNYVVGDSIYFYNNDVGQVYDCIADHLSTTANNPAGIDGVTYWAVATTNKKSGFIIQADELKVITPNNTVTPLLTLDGDALRINVPTTWGNIEGKPDIPDLTGLGDMAYENSVEYAKLGTTLISGGFIKTSLLDVNNIIATGSILVTGQADLTQTRIDGGVTTTGSLRASNAAGTEQAGIAGGGSLASDIRIWAGATHANRANAKFRVQADGTVVIQSATSGSYLKIENDRIDVYDNNVLRVRLGQL